jgi:hypothetical protein
MLFIDHVLRSMAQYIFGAALLAYLVLPLKSHPTTIEYSGIQILNGPSLSHGDVDPDHVSVLCFPL